MGTLLSILEWVVGFFITRKKETPNVALDEAKELSKPIGSDDDVIGRL